MAEYAVTCVGCGQGFTAARSNARWCSGTCKKRAQRAARAAASVVELEAAAAAAQADEPEAGGPAEHELVKAVRDELVEAGALGTVAGQLALQMARRIANPDTAGISTLSKELRSLLAEAKGDAPTPPPEPGAPDTGEEDDEVAAARRAREDKLRAAAGRA